MNRILSIICLLMLSACFSPEAAKQRQAALAADDNAECGRLGFRPGTDAFAGCLLRAKELRQDQRREETTVIFNPYRGAPDENLLH